MYKLTCSLCNKEFEYERKYIGDEEDVSHPDDWLIECPHCDNWEEVGNNRPQTFEVLKAE